MASSSVLTLVMKKLTDVIDHLSHEIGIQTFDAGKEVRKLEQVLQKLECILEDAEEKQLGDEEVCDYLGRIKDLVYDTEDLLDELVLHIQQKKMIRGRFLNISQKGDNNNTISKVCSSLAPTFGYVFNSCVIFNRFKKITSLRKKFEKIKVESSKYDLISNTVPVIPVDSSYTHSCDGNFFDGDVVYGREFDKEHVMNMLFEVDNTKAVRVINIVGIGGIGKTTLGQSVYDHDKVRSHFDIKIWVSVPQTAASYLEKTVQGILEALSLSSSSDDDDLNCVANSHGADLSTFLSNRIKQKKFLLVLDDVWNENIRDWQALKSILVGAPGSSILSLTCNKMAAYLMSTTTLHELIPLSKESAWELFCQSAYRKKDDAADALKPYEDIGRIVSQRCNGVPLALKCLGGLLRTKATRQEWVDIMESDKWELLEMEPVLPALYFSYYSLPPVLKLCFSYTALFPKAYPINKGRLIKLWMAEGFLGSSTTKNRDPELVGLEYFQELMMRSYFSPHERNKDGEVTSIKMHDLVHDLAASMSGHSIMEIDNTPYKKIKARHLSVLHGDLNSISSSIQKSSHVSTLIFYNSNCRVISRTVSPNLFAHLKFLKVLDFSYLNLSEIPNEVGKLKHLRYLNLSHANLQSLPEKVCDLHNLQTLALNDCQQLSKLPDSLVKLSGLRHLEIQSTPKLLYLPQGTGRLTSLQTLSKFPVSIAKQGCRIRELQDLNKLQGCINIIGLHTVENFKEVSDAKLMNKENLHELRLDFSPYKLEYLGEDEFKKTERVLEYLHPHPNIKKLTLTHFLGSELPRWLENDSMLPNLRRLKLQDCMNSTMLPALGNLPSLVELYIENLGSIKDIGNEFYGIGSSCKYVKELAFPKLEELHIVDMAKLEHWDFIAPDEKKIMPFIRDLHIRNCPKLIVLPHFFPDTLKNMDVSGCAKLISSSLDNLVCKKG
ncbi:hypothetical protein MKX03_006995 [Papaver bracteatum]|nr:hypothetical protein MKX03_006995 [Papaver bracteatum]